MQHYCAAQHKSIMKIFAQISIIFFHCLFNIASHADTRIGLNMTGKIIETPCIVSTNSKNQTISFPDVLTTNGVAPGTLATNSFAILLDQCPASQQYATIKFYGTPDAINSTRAYSNSGTAKNVAIEIVTSYNIEMGNGKVATLSLLNEKTFKFNASLVSRGNITAGTIQAVVTAELIYN